MSRLSNAATLVARGVHHLEIQAVLAKALDIEGSRQNKCDQENPCDIYFADTDITLDIEGSRQNKCDLGNLCDIYFADTGITLRKACIDRLQSIHP